MKRYAIIVAGGSGQRMKSSVPKQFLTINNEIILMMSIKLFYNFDQSIEIIIALPENQISTWKNLCLKHNFNINHTIVSGGKTRYHSVKNALAKINTEGIVAIHDGVRPLASKNTLEQVFEKASSKGNAVPYTDSVDSIRFVGSNTNHPVDREKYKLIQTPQAFDVSLIKRAYKQAWEESFTDDASVVEKLGQKINLTLGNKENIKITSQVDLKIAEVLHNYLSE